MSTGLNITDALGLFNAFKEMTAPPVTVGQPYTQPAVGAPAAYPIIHPNGAQDVIDATLYVQPVEVIGDAAVEEPPISDAELAMMFGQASSAVREIEEFGFGGKFASIFGSPQMAEMRQRYPDLAGYGGPLDMITNFFTSASEKTLGGLGAATKTALAALNKAHSGLVARVNTVERNQKSVNTNTSRRIGNLEATTRQLTAKWNQYNGTGSRYQRLILTVAQSWPGIKANRLIHDPALVEFFAIFKRFFAAIESELASSDLVAVPTFGAAYVQTEANATLTALNANIAALRDDVDAVMGLLNELAAGVVVNEASKKSADTFHAYISNRALLDQLAEVMPSQLQDQTQAMWEAGAKYVGPRPAKAGAGLLAGLGL